MKKAPWTKKEVDALNRCQESGTCHPFTCDLYEITRQQHKENPTIPIQDCGWVLKATETGWVCTRKDCPYFQDWAHDFMFDY